MTNATFSCECTHGDLCGQLFWSLENEGSTFATSDYNDLETFTQRGITFSSTATTAVISIPDRVENNTLVSCAAIVLGGIEFSDPPVRLIIIGESE